MTERELNDLIQPHLAAVVLAMLALLAAIAPAARRKMMREKRFWR